MAAGLLDGPLAGSWRRPELAELQRLPMRPPLVPHPDLDGARAGVASDSPWWRGLDGTWRFRRYGRPEDVPAVAVTDELDEGGWTPITVPGVWTRQGHDEPVYTNVVMPFDAEVPEVPEANPTGVYRRRFVLPRAWRGRRTVVTFGGAETVLYVWCNGRFVGMSTDSRLAAEFDLTDHLRPGSNLLVAVVVRWGAATWLEDQDHWHHAGLHRSVTLTSTASTWLADVAPLTGYDAGSGVGRLDLTVRVGSSGRLEPGWRVLCRVETQRGRALTRRPLVAEVPTATTAPGVAGLLDAVTHAGPVVTFAATFQGVGSWSHETPVRHRLLTTLVGPDGRVVEAVGQWIGFRSVEVADRCLVLNGAPVEIRGVNRHDHHPETGKTADADEVRRELVAMKGLGFNAVRTAHYPNDPVVVDLCDELGLWVVAEANVEAHARAPAIAHDPRFETAVLERVRRLVQRDRGHPSIMGWSLGNESGYGAVHDAAAAWVRRTDPTRFVQYEGALEVLGDAPIAGVDGRAATDVVCPMYASVEAIVDWAATDDERPLVLCEYSHAMGNSNGGLVDYWDAIERTPGLQGGFVWDWRDQGLAEVDDEGRPYWAHGAHLGGDRHDANFCINGVVGPDLTPHPGAAEHARLAEPVRFDGDPGTGSIEVENRRWFTDLADLTFRWLVTADGERLADGPLVVGDVGPRSTRRVVLGLPEVVAPDGARVLLELEARARRERPWAPRGSLVAWGQLQLEPGTFDHHRWRPPGRGAVGADVDGTTGAVTVSGPEAEVELGPAVASLWRPPTDNDGVVWSDGFVSGALRRWLAWGLDRLATVDVDVTRRGSAWTVRRHLAADAGSVTQRQRLSIEDGWIVVDEELTCPAEWDDLPRVGVTFILHAARPGDLERLDWLGLGPGETYPDRRTAGRHGRWRSTVTEQYHPFVRPQEHGAHVDTRWFELSGDGRRGVRVSAARPFVFSVSHLSDRALGAAGTVADADAARDPGTVHVHVDAAVRGLGTGACGPDTAPVHRVAGGRHRWRWFVAPSAPGPARSV